MRLSNSIQHNSDKLNHTWSICAYGQSEFLEECVLSVLNQTVSSNVILCTSTPNDLINRISKKYGIELFVNSESKGIASDWNFALKCANTSLVTIAHQDDLYLPKYTETIINKACENSSSLILFTDYAEYRNNIPITSTLNLNIKRLLLSKAKHKTLNNSRDKRSILKFGTPICCPSVTYNLNNINLPVFLPTYKCDLDWETWEKLSKEKGGFVFLNDVLMYHRIHSNSETTNSINNNIRTSEDLAMFEKFWPKLVARLINNIYGLSQKSNTL